MKHVFAFSTMLGVLCAVLFWPGPATPGAAFNGLVIGHRGMVGEDVRENSVAAVQAAHRSGATAVEIDVRLSSDGAPMAMHDPVDATAEELKTQGFSSFADVAATAHSLGMYLEVDLKEAFGIRAVVSVLRDEQMLDQVWVTSFSPLAVWWWHQDYPDLPVGYAVAATRFGPIDRLRLGLAPLLGASVVEPEAGVLSDDQLEAWVRAEYAVNVWVINDAADQAHLEDLGVSFTTDTPSSDTLR
jgi:glycerophosphoryl diester phosphodiesterase